jgi:hypothetical protein
MTEFFAFFLVIAGSILIGVYSKLPPSLCMIMGMVWGYIVTKVLL